MDQPLLIKFSTKEGKFDINENEFVTMQIMSEKWTNNSTQVLRIENHTENILNYGTIFSLEYFNKNKWKSIPLDDVIWLTILLGLLPNESNDEKIGLFQMIKKYNKGKKGRYRLSRNFYLYSIDDRWDRIGVIKLSTEFEIK